MGEDNENLKENENSEELLEEPRIDIPQVKAKKKYSNESVKDAGIPEWVVTFGDMMTLLLCFFILLFGMSDIRAEKMKVLIQSMEIGHFGIHRVKESGSRLGLDVISDPIVDKAEIVTQDEMGANLREISQIDQYFQKYVFENKLGGELLFEMEQRGAVFTISDKVVFEDGTATLRPESYRILEKVWGLFKQFDYQVRIEGHTDPSPIIRKSFPSNWELSAARAAVVAKYFIKQGMVPLRIIIEGFAHHKPLVSNDTAEGRARNRRVELVYLRTSIKDEWRLDVERKRE